MKKRLLLGIVICVMLVSMTGCNTNSKGRDKSLKALQKAGVVEKQIELVDQFEFASAGIIPHTEDYYVYETEQAGTIVIYYRTDISSSAEYKYSAEVYEDVSMNVDVEYIDDTSQDDSFYRYQEGPSTRECKYNLDDASKKTYYFEKRLFGYKVVKSSTQ